MEAESRAAMHAGIGQREIHRARRETDRAAQIDPRIRGAQGRDLVHARLDQPAAIVADFERGRRVTALSFGHWRKAHGDGQSQRKRAAQDVSRGRKRPQRHSTRQRRAQS